MLIYNHRFYHTYEFFKFCEDHKIKAVGIPPNITHLLQLLDICIFQLLKHWYIEAVNEAVQNGDKTFSKIEFLNKFCCKLSRKSTSKRTKRIFDRVPYLKPYHYIISKKISYYFKQRKGVKRVDNGGVRGNGK